MYVSTDTAHAEKLGAAVAHLPLTTYHVVIFHKFLGAVNEAVKNSYDTITYTHETDTYPEGFSYQQFNNVRQRVDEINRRLREAQNTNNEPIEQ